MKWDGRIHRTGALFFELTTNVWSNEPGWAEYTQADVIYYGSAEEKLFYVFSAADMKDYLETHKGCYETRTASDYDKRTGAIRKQSRGAIIPLATFCEEVPV